MKLKTLKYSVSVAVFSTLICATPTFASPIDSQVAQTKGQITQTQGQISKTQDQIDALETKIQQMDNQIIIGMEKSQKLNEAIKAQQGQIENTKAEIEKDKKDLENHKDVYSQRLRSIQEQGQTPLVTYAELLLSSKNLSEFLTRSTAISEILQSDSNIMTTLNEKEQALNNAEQQLTHELGSLKESKDELASEQKTIESVKLQVENEVAANKNILQQQQGQLSQQQDKLTQQQAQQQSERLAAQQAEQARQQALLAQQRARQQAQQQAQQSSGNSTSGRSTSTSSSSGGQSTGTNSSASASQVISYAEQFLGVPYVWGGTTPSGFDCSGLMQYVFLHAAGIHLPRVAMDQQNVGTRISPYDVQPGDLIFMGDPAYHVGMYIGNGEWIEAPETGDVVKIVHYNPARFSSAARIL